MRNKTAVPEGQLDAMWPPKVPCQGQLGAVRLSKTLIQAQLGATRLSQTPFQGKLGRPTAAYAVSKFLNIGIN